MLIPLLIYAMLNKMRGKVAILPNRGYLNNQKSLSVYCLVFLTFVEERICLMHDERVKPESLFEECQSLEYQLILFNDDFNTFDYVIECLVDVCGHDMLQAEQCALLAHSKGKCTIMSGEADTLQAYKNSLQNRGLTVEINS